MVIVIIILWVLTVAFAGIAKEENSPECLAVAIGLFILSLIAEYYMRR